MGNTKQEIEVVAAAVVRGNQVLATQRGYGKWQGWWEFPGGKIEPTETHTAALQRELREELALDAEVLEHIATACYDYTDFHLTMHLYHCVARSQIRLLEHWAARWVDAATIATLRWLPADVQVLPAVAALIEKQQP